MLESKDGVGKQDFVAGLHKLGLKKGHVVLLQSALRPVGPVQGGAAMVVEAFLEVLGAEGTLVAPTFTFKHEAEKDPVIDPKNDASEMGVISEAVRLHPAALRSVAFRHSFAAIGRRAAVITQIDPRLSVFDHRSSFGVMLGLNTQVILLGVTYSSSTSHHFAEWVSEVPYRRIIPLQVKVRKPDGSVVPQEMTDYQPKPGADGSYHGSRNPDFNHLGKMLEHRGMACVTAIGNAVVRCFAMRDLIDLAQVEAEKDYNIFRTAEGDHGFTQLDFGTIVLSNEMSDGAGRRVRYQWSIVDSAKLKIAR